MKKILFLSVVMLAFSISTFAQATASAAASATIVSPIAIAQAADMNFGNIAVSATGGTVVLSPAGVRTITGGVTLPATTGTVSAASFNVTGTGSYTYAITLPSGSITITNPASVTMSVGSFTSTPSGTGALDGAGTQTLTVGATLTVAAGQASGLYDGGSFDVTVNYN